MLYTVLAVFIMAGAVFLVGTVLGVAIALGGNRARTTEGNLAIGVHPLKQAAAVNAPLAAAARSALPLAA